MRHADVVGQPRGDEVHGREGVLAEALDGIAAAVVGERARDQQALLRVERDPVRRLLQERPDDATREGVDGLRVGAGERGLGLQQVGAEDPVALALALHAREAAGAEHPQDRLAEQAGGALVGHAVEAGEQHERAPLVVVEHRDAGGDQLQDPGARRVRAREGVARDGALCAVRLERLEGQLADEERPSAAAPLDLLPRRLVERHLARDRVDHRVDLGRIQRGEVEPLGVAVPP